MPDVRVYRHRRLAPFSQGWGASQPKVATVGNKALVKRLSRNLYVKLNAYCRKEHPHFGNATFLDEELNLINEIADRRGTPRSTMHASRRTSLPQHGPGCIPKASPRSKKQAPAQDPLFVPRTSFPDDLHNRQRYFEPTKVHIFFPLANMRYEDAFIIMARIVQLASSDTRHIHYLEADPADGSSNGVGLYAAR
jgi:hypothetical protein